MRPGTLGLTRRGVRPPSVGEALSVEPPRERRVLREAGMRKTHLCPQGPAGTPVFPTHGAPRLEPAAVIAVATAACSRQVQRAGRPRRCEISSSGPVPFILGRCHSLRASGARCREGVNGAKPAGRAVLRSPQHAHGASSGLGTPRRVQTLDVLSLGCPLLPQLASWASAERWQGEAIEGSRGGLAA